MWNLFPEVAKNRCLLGQTSDGIPVVNAIGDNQASFLGAVKEPEKSILVNVGTGSQVSCMGSAYAKTSGMETRPFVDGQYLFVNSPLCGGRAYAMLADFYQSIMDGFLRFNQDDRAIEKDDVYGFINSLLEMNFTKLLTDKEQIRIESTFCGTAVSAPTTDSKNLPAIIFRGGDELRALRLEQSESQCLYGPAGNRGL